MSISIPSSVLAAGWIPFVIVIVLVLLFSSIYVKYYTSKYDSEWSSTLSAVFALSITLMTTALIPVDVFLVSYMKNSDGTFKDWAQDNETRRSTESTVLVGYYTMYGLITFCMFLLLPFMYFFYEEREEDATCKSRCCGALKYSIVFLILIFVLLLIGALVHTRDIPKTSSNGTNIDWQKIEALFDMESNWLENSLSLVISILSLIGMLALFTYTAYGMAALPIGMIKGSRGVRGELMRVQDQRTDNKDRISTIRNKYTRGKSLSRRDASRISDLEESEALMERQERHLHARDTCCQKCLLFFRPFAIVFGILLILVSALVFLSLLLTNIDKALHSLGPKLGYALPKRTLPNPVDIVLVFCQQVFPLDYILFSALVFYLIFCSISGIRNIGIWFFCLKMYKIRPRRTRPQGMMMMCMILMFITLAINIILYELTPQYSSFGSQHFRNGTGNATQVQPCSTAQSEDECVITRMSLLLTRFFYKMWFFGAAYYWGTWAFLLFILVGFVVAICKKARSSIDGEVDSDDIVDSDEEMIDG